MTESIPAEQGIAVQAERVEYQSRHGYIVFTDTQREWRRKLGMGPDYTEDYQPRHAYDPASVWPDQLAVRMHYLHRPRMGAR